jgi:chemotaxis protein MotB
MAGGGGSWKVAYADFVTAMMALFMVLWLTSQDQKIKEAIERAFRHPYHAFENKSAGLLPNETVQHVKASQGNFDSMSAIELMMLRQMNQKLLQSLSQDPLIQENEQTFELQITDDGVLLRIFDSPSTPIFEKDSVDFTEYGSWVVGSLAWVLERMDKFDVDLSGHTEQAPDGLSTSDLPWTISIDRANAARMLLVKRGLRPHRIARISGYGDTQPMSQHPPTSEANRRIEVLMRVKKT